jgi:hypothetical protein
MADHIDTRVSLKAGSGVLPEYPLVTTPWGKLISLHEAYHYACRHNAVVATTFMQVLRIIVPDYNTRAKALCEINHDLMYRVFSNPKVQEKYKERFNVHPFVKGSMVGTLKGDQGDEVFLMAGRVNDYGTYRFEKELDICPWDIVGSEYCRATTFFFQAVGEAFDEPSMEYNMVEARGCGDRHCRIVGENREIYPMPKKAIHQSFGPIATADQIQVTPEDRCFKEPQHFRPECGYKFRNGFCAEWTAAEMYSEAMASPLGTNNIIPVLDAMEPDKEKVELVTKCMFEAAGKMAFSEFAAVKGVRDWLGVPGDINDGRVLGGLIQVVLQSILCKYTIQSFDENEVVLDLDQNGLEHHFPLLTKAYLSMWYGMSKTLVGAEWSLWRETEGVPKSTLRIKIAKKIDKYC